MSVQEVACNIHSVMSLHLMIKCPAVFSPGNGAQPMELVGSGRVWIDFCRRTAPPRDSPAYKLIVRCQFLLQIPHPQHSRCVFHLVYHALSSLYPQRYPCVPVDMSAHLSRPNFCNESCVIQLNPDHTQGGCVVTDVGILGTAVGRGAAEGGAVRSFGGACRSRKGALAIRRFGTRRCRRHRFRRGLG